MYEIFFYNRKIILTNDFNLLENKNIFFDKKVIFNEKNYSLQKIISDFEKNTSVNSMCIFSENLEKLFEIFLNNFEIIEAAGGLVFNKKNQFLAIFRFGKWDLPKGKKENDEKNEETAIREIEEECGISNLKIIGNLKTVYHTYKLNEKFILKITYWFKVFYGDNEKLIPQKEEDILDVKWINFSDKNFFIKNTYNSLKKIFQDEN